ncbi:TetR/AcrR family transcriptional regulator C-terminal domain-containing protein, partial [Streptomyces sp. NPDC005989]|uniref:TetR/AcrR family transcriptional regulator C-terminal domain-containing protein n=1 Tax=Streptomyces sp. NPDC005989 TaxID=3156727 RepID=UPI0033F5D7AF
QGHEERSQGPYGHAGHLREQRQQRRPQGEGSSDAGLDEEAAAYAYGTLHDFVTGHVAIRLGRGDLELHQLPPERRAASVFADHHDYDRRFSFGLDFVIGGIAAAATPVSHEEQR